MGPGVPRTSDGQHVLLAELEQLLRGGIGAGEVVQRVPQVVARLVPAGAEVSLSVVRAGEAVTVAFAGDRARELDQVQGRVGSGPGPEALWGGETVEILDTGREARWPGLMPVFAQAGVAGVLAVPVPAADVLAGITVYASAAGGFTDEHRRWIGECAELAGVALGSVQAALVGWDQAAERHAAVRSRAVIEQAKGVLMEQHGVSAEQAFRLMAEVAGRVDTAVLDLAERLVTTRAPLR